MGRHPRVIDAKLTLVICEVPPMLGIFSVITPVPLQQLLSPSRVCVRSRPVNDHGYHARSKRVWL